MWYKTWLYVFQWVHKNSRMGLLNEFWCLKIVQMVTICRIRRQQWGECFCAIKSQCCCVAFVFCFCITLQVYDQNKMTLFMIRNMYILKILHTNTSMLSHKLSLHVLSHDNALISISQYKMFYKLANFHSLYRFKHFKNYSL
jgi:hypothetical protein